MTLRIAAIVAAASAVALAAPAPLRLVLVAQHPSPVLTTRSPGAEGIRFGFEGGREWLVQHALLRPKDGSR